MKALSAPPLLGFLLGMVGVFGFSACSGGDCGPLQLYVGTYKVKNSRGFNDPTPMKKGTLHYDEQAARVTITYSSSHGEGTVVLKASPYSIY